MIFTSAQDTNLLLNPFCRLLEMLERGPSYAHAYTQIYMGYLGVILFIKHTTVSILTWI